MIGEMLISIKNLSINGIRISADVEAVHEVGGGESHLYTFDITMTRDLQLRWGISDTDIERAMKEIVSEIYSPGIGLDWSAPADGYWFDTFNSEATIADTIGKMRNDGRVSFLKNPAIEDRISGIFGGAIISELEATDEMFAQKHGSRFLRAPDRAFIRSRAVLDLSTPPENERDLTHKISLLATIIDNFNVRLAEESAKTGSIKALANWLTIRCGEEEAWRVTEAFARVRDLRNQYPIHDQFEKGTAGASIERRGVEAAENFFGFRRIDDVTAKWKKICDLFRTAVKETSYQAGKGQQVV